jgi:hypothetical protein
LVVVPSVPSDSCSGSCSGSGSGSEEDGKTSEKSKALRH